MRLLVLFLVCSIGLTYAADSYAQKALISIDVRNQRVEDVLKEIEAQSDFAEDIVLVLYPCFYFPVFTYFENNITTQLGGFHFGREAPVFSGIKVLYAIYVERPFGR